MTDIILTPEGFEKAKNELDSLIKKRSAIVDRIAAAKELGDLKENADYHDARDEQGFNEGRIQELETIIRTAEVVEKNTTYDTVAIGALVTVENDGKKFEYSIVGTNEASPKDNKLSLESPLVKAMLDRKKGDAFEFDAPLGRKKFTIIDIN
jgi:transcription elongation factor GreA